MSKTKEVTFIESSSSNENNTDQRNNNITSNNKLNYQNDIKHVTNNILMENDFSYIDDDVDDDDDDNIKKTSNIIFNEISKNNNIKIIENSSALKTTKFSNNNNDNLILDKKDIIKKFPEKLKSRDNEISITSSGSSSSSKKHENLDKIINYNIKIVKKDILTKNCSNKLENNIDDNNIKNNNKSPHKISDKIAYEKCESNKTHQSNITDQNSKIKLAITDICDDTSGDNEEDPYVELQEYLEKVKREINDVFEEYKTKNREIENPNSTCSIASINSMNSDLLLKQQLNSLQTTSTNEIQMNKEKFQIHLDDNNEKFNNKTNESKDVNIWANKIIQELDNLVASNEAASNKLKKYHDHKTIVKLEKHATIPLQSFNLDDNSTLTKSKTKYNNNDNALLKLQVIKNEKNDEQQLPQHSLLNPLKKDETVLKIEEDFSNNHKIPISNLSPTTQIKLKRDKQNYLQSSTSSPGSGEFSKKSSTSTIWTSEESILRNAVQFDEDTKSTSSFDEASGILSSGKSRNSLDSSELDNEQTESGIGTATPPKDTDTNLRKTQKFKLIKSNSVQSSSDDPDLLEVLSLYEGIVNDDEHDYDSIIKQHNYIADDIDNNYDDTQEVVLRKKTSEPKINDHHRYAMSMPFNRALKTRSHIIEPSKFCHTSSSVSQKDFKYTTGSKESIGIGNSFGQDNFVNNSISSSNIQELPSQSSASLFSGNDHNIGMEIVELTTKSNSAPLLMKKVKKRDEFNYGQKENTLRYSRSQSDRYLAEIEAIEACKWLKAAGFPQYAQMYEDLQFPIDLSNVAKDHPVLENDPLQSLYRRLCILNRCAALRLDNAHHRSHQGPQKDDSDDEGFALSDNWTFQPQSRRWSRIGEMGLELPTTKNKDKVDSSSKESSPERYDDDDDDDDDHTRNLNLSKTDSESMTRLRRTGSERLKDGAKAFLRRVESIKSRRRKRQNRDGFVMSGGGGTGHNHHNRQQVLDLKIIQPSSDTTNIKDKAGINIVFSTPPSPSAVSPIHFYPRNLIGNELKIPTENSTIFLHPNRLSPKHIPTTPRSCHSMRSSPLHFFTNPMPHLKEGKSDESSSYFSDSQDSSAGDKLTNMKKITNRSRRFLQRSGKVDDIGAHSDSECHAGTGRKFIVKDQNSTDQEGKGKKLSRGGSLNLGKESKKYRDKFHNRSFRSGGGSTVKKGKDNTETKTNKIPVVRWHSFQTHEKPPLIFKKCFDENAELKQKEKGPLFAAMSCGQLQVLRKLALVTLTGYMEHYCPSHRTGWNWELPKFIKKIKTPDYKDKKVFGVPLLLILQRSGKCFPIGITAAMRWLQLNALEQTGLFRKSGVKSRIIKLKETIEILELYEDCMDMFDNQQAYDIADMLKQYFRELPDSLLTAKMSETFVAICQHLPPEKRLDAVQAAILLLPDENRDVLYTLLAFLNDVASKSHINQMTASNLAVCLAPSLFNGNIATGNPVAVSPRRRNKSGSPSMKELSETKASHECLTLMIDQYKEIYTATTDRINKCNFGYMEESNPVTLEALGDGMPFHNWRGYLYECTSATMKEGREKTRGWIAINSLDPAIDIGYKKVNDGHLLRLWRCLTEIEGPPGDVLNFILNERSIWDGKLIKSQLIKQLDERTEIVQYVIDGQIPTDFCVLRSWQINLPKQACVIVETSIKHRDAIPMQGSIRGVVLASRYLIEPCGSGRSRVMHLSRVDLKGKTPEWYNKNYGHICSQYLSKIRNAFRHVADGPESKV